MTTPARLHQLIEPIVNGLGLELFDLHYSGSVLAVLVEGPVPVDASGARGARPGVDLAALTTATRAVSRALDEADPIPGHYSLEVSSPGLERPLRTPAHYRGAIGEKVSVKTTPAHDGPRRVRGELTAVAEDEGSVEVRDESTGEIRRLPIDEIDRARTVFEWGPQPKPPKPGRRKGGGASRAAPPARPASRSEPDPTIDAEDKKVNAT